MECGDRPRGAGEDEAKTVRPVASAGIEEGYLATLKITWADTERGQPGELGRVVEDRA